MPTKARELPTSVFGRATDLPSVRSRAAKGNKRNICATGLRNSMR